MDRGDGKIAGWAAMIGGVSALILTPLFATSYLAPGEDAPTPLIDAVRSSLEPLLDFGSTDQVYRTYGVAYLVCAALMAYGLYVFRGRIALTVADAPDRGLAVLLVGWMLFLVGLFGDYVVSDTFGDILHSLFFLIEMLGVLGILIGCTAVGLRLRRAPGWSAVAWSLILVVPLGIIGSLLVGHLPSGPMVGACLAAIIVGYALASGQESATLVA